MVTNPTVIAASLNDQELRKSIDSLVKYVQNQTGAMSKAFDDNVQKMENAIKNLGSRKGGSSKSSDNKATEDVTKLKTATQEATKATEDLGKAMQKAAGSNKVIEQYDAQLVHLRNRLKEVRQDIDIYNAAIGSRKASQVSWGQEGLRQANKEAEKLMTAITTMERSRGNIVDVLKPGDSFKNYIKSLTEANSELARLKQQYRNNSAEAQYMEKLRSEHAKVARLQKEQADTQRMVEEATKRSTQSAQEYSAEVQKIAAEVRKSASFQKENLGVRSGFFNYDGRTLHVSEDLANNIRLEDEIQAAIQRVNAERQKGVNTIHQQTQAVQELSEKERHAQELLGWIETPKVKKAYVSPSFNLEHINEVRGAMQVLTGFDAKWIEDINKAGASYRELNTYVKELVSTYNDLTTKERNSPAGKTLAREIQDVNRRIRETQQQLSRPINLSDALGHPEKTLDQINYKMQQLKAYRSTLNLDTERGQISQVNSELDRLQKKQTEVLSSNERLRRSNDALSRSWSYMKNRLAFYLTVGATTSFVRKMADIRGQYEMTEKALGVLIGSAERGTHVFNELSQMALISPYTLIELSNAARQLTAYGVEARNLVDTTRRLADVAAAVGAPIENIAYALGHVQSYGYLTSLQARQFANNGIPLVKELARRYSELEGRVVSVSDVYDRMKKKQVEYNDVMGVLTSMTDAGGRFFDFQAKMADTLKVRLANLTLAYNNMLNEIGKSNQGMLHSAISILRDLFANWKKIADLLSNVAWVVGITVAIRLLNVVAVRLGATWGWLNKELTLSQAVGKRVATMLKGLRSVLTSSVTWWGVLAMAAISAFSEITDSLFGIERVTREFNQGIREAAKSGLTELTDFAKQYADVRKELERPPANGASGGVNIDIDTANKTWEAMREQIELSSAASAAYIEKLMQVENVSERLRQGFKILDSTQEVKGALKDISDDTFVLTKEWSAWWNLWAAPDGLVQNVKDYSKALREAKEAMLDGESVFAYARKDLVPLQNDVDKLTESINNFISLKQWGGDPQKIAETYASVLDKLSTDNSLAPDEAFNLQLVVEEARSKAVRQGLEIQIADYKAALAIQKDAAVESSLAIAQEELANFEKTNGVRRVYWDSFTKWMKEQHTSEVIAMFNNMSAEQIRSLNFQKGKYANFVDGLVKKFADEHKWTYAQTFDMLKFFVRDANRMSIFIPLIIGDPKNKTVFSELEKADQDLSDANKKIDRLNTRIGELSKKTKKTKEETKELTEAEKERAQAEKDRDEAIARGGHDSKTEKKDAAARRRAAKDRARTEKEAESEVQRALKEEISLIDKARSVYKTLTKEGIDAKRALTLATSGYDETIKSINNTFRKYGITPFDLTKYAGVANPREITKMLEDTLNTLMASGKVKPAEIKDLQVKIKDLRVDAATFDQKTFVESLDNQLTKIKDEYELALELDSDPELGNAFADMFGIDVDSLPRTFGEALERANKALQKELKENGIDAGWFDLLSSDVRGLAATSNTEVDSNFIEKLASQQKAFRDAFKKNLLASEKNLDDYIKKHGEYSDRIAEIESNRLDMLKQLNDTYYTEDMRKSSEYQAKKLAIEKGAQEEEAKVRLEEFKESPYYEKVFENLSSLSIPALQRLKAELATIKDSLAQNLPPKDLEVFVKKMEEVDKITFKKNPFKGLGKAAKEYYRSQTKEGKNERKRNAQRLMAAKEVNDKAKEYLGSLKKQREQKQRQSPLDKEGLAALDEKIKAQQEIVDSTQQEVDAAQEAADKYDLMVKLFKERAAAVGQTLMVIGQNLQSIADFRDMLSVNFNIHLSDELDAVIDDLAVLGKGIQQVVQSAQSGDVFGVLTGVGNVVYGVFDGIASVFGDGSARTKRLNRQIEKSQEEVRKLGLAYENLQRKVEKALGEAELYARRDAIANKQAQLAELERQKSLEESKRKKDRDNDAIKQYEEQIQSLRNEIQDLRDDVVETLLGQDVKSAAEAFVDAWVEAWRAGETTLDAINGKMDEMILNLVKKSMTNRIVGNILQPLYDEVDKITSAKSEGGAAVTIAEAERLSKMAGGAAVSINEALGAFFKNLDQLNIVKKDIEGNAALSALQQGIQGITENTAGALEAYMNGVSQQVYYQSDVLTQIRDCVIGFDLDMQNGIMSQMLLQMQQSYQVQMSIQNILESVLNPSGRAFNVELIS